MRDHPSTGKDKEKVHDFLSAIDSMNHASMSGIWICQNNSTKIVSPKAQKFGITRKHRVPYTATCACTHSYYAKNCLKSFQHII